jgi:hypothetical protein
MNSNNYIAANRFGMGVGPQKARLADTTIMPWLWAQVQQPEAPSLDFSGLASAQQNAAQLIQARKAGDKKLEKEVKRGLKEVFLSEMRARIIHAVTTTMLFYERLVDF